MGRRTGGDRDTLRWRDLRFSFLKVFAFFSFFSHRSIILSATRKENTSLSVLGPPGLLSHFHKYLCLRDIEDWRVVTDWYFLEPHIKEGDIEVGYIDDAPHL